MINAIDAVVWINTDTHEVMVWPFSRGRPGGAWCDPIGAAYSKWDKMSNAERTRLMIETAIELATIGFAMKDILIAFAEVVEFRALGSESCPMCRALTSALLGGRLESFEELLETHH